jgi:hypothetical protein
LANVLDEPWASRRQTNQISDADLLLASRQFNNVIKEMRIEVKVIKMTGP